MQTVLNTPMLADGTSQSFGPGRQTGDEVTHLVSGLSGSVIDAVANHHDDARQSCPCVRGDHRLGRGRHIRLTRLRSTMTLLDLTMASHLSAGLVCFPPL